MSVFDEGYAEESREANDEYFGDPAYDHDDEQAEEDDDDDSD
jgi:hypothetical protein